MGWAQNVEQLPQSGPGPCLSKARLYVIGAEAEASSTKAKTAKAKRRMNPILMADGFWWKCHKLWQWVIKTVTLSSRKAGFSLAKKWRAQGANSPSEKSSIFLCRVATSKLRMRWLTGWSKISLYVGVWVWPTQVSDWGRPSSVCFNVLRGFEHLSSSVSLISPKIYQICPKHPALTSHDMTKAEKHSDGFSEPACEVSETQDKFEQNSLNLKPKLYGYA